MSSYIRKFYLRKNKLIFARSKPFYIKIDYFLAKRH